MTCFVNGQRVKWKILHAAKSTTLYMPKYYLMDGFRFQQPESTLNRKLFGVCECIVLNTIHVLLIIMQG